MSRYLIRVVERSLPSRLTSYALGILLWPGNIRVSGRASLVGLLLLPLIGSFAPLANAADWLYTVRPDDKLWTLSERFCGTHTRWRDIATHNQLSQPTRLRVGSQLRIPIEWLIEEPAAAKVVYTRGNSTLNSGQGGEPVALENGAELGVGTVLLTGPGSYVNVEFADGSMLQVGPDSEVVFDALSAYKDTGMVDSRVRINRGAGASRVSKQSGPGAVYRISTPLGVAAVRGTQFRTRAVGDASFVETTDGAVQFIAPSGATDVTRGFGLKADPDGIALEELLPAPDLGTPRNYGAHEALQWNGPADAASYLVRVYADNKLSQIISGGTVPSPRYLLASLAPGSYVLGVRGISSSGLQGLEATQPLVVVQALATPEGVRLRQPRLARELSISWDAVNGAQDYEVTARAAGGADPIVRITQATELVLQDLPTDTYRVSVVARDGEIASDPSAEIDKRVQKRSLWGLGGIVLAIALAL